MPRPAAPSMPTERQIKEAYEAVKALNSGARILRVGPEGVTFDYGEGGKDDGYTGRPFTAEGTG